MGFAGIPGHEFVGVVERSDDPAWIGKRVVGEINAACGRCCFCIRGMKNHCSERTVLGSRCGPFKPALEALSQKKVDVQPLIAEVFPLKRGKEAFRKAAERGVLKVLLRP